MGHISTAAGNGKGVVGIGLIIISGRGSASQGADSRGGRH
jgi:hypothetical protein